MKTFRLLSVLSALFLLAVPFVRAVAPDETPAGHHHEHGSGHVHKPLMGGQLVEVGEHQFNLEFKYDHERGVLQAWVLDAHAENFVRIAALSFEVREEDGEKRPITLRALGNDISGEKPGDSSSFEGEAKWLGVIKHFDGIVKSLKIREVEFHDINFRFHPQE